MIDEAELWAFAQALLRQDAANAEEFPPARLAQLEQACRLAGLNLYLEAANRINAHVFDGLPSDSGL